MPCIVVVLVREGGPSTAQRIIQFAVIQTSTDNPLTFEVTRRVSGTEDTKPEGYKEPTAQQKQ